MGQATSSASGSGREEIFGWCTAAREDMENTWGTSNDGGLACEWCCSVRRGVNDVESCSSQGMGTMPVLNRRLAVGSQSLSRLVVPVLLAHQAFPPPGLSDVNIALTFRAAMEKPSVSFSTFHQP